MWSVVLDVFWWLLFVVGSVVVLFFLYELFTDGNPSKEERRIGKSLDARARTWREHDERQKREARLAARRGKAEERRAQEQKWKEDARRKQADVAAHNGRKTPNSNGEYHEGI